jgi:GAF domain-containing protein
MVEVLAEPEEAQAGPEEAQAWPGELIERLLRALLVVGIPAVLGGSYFAYRSQNPWAIPVYAGLYALLVLITFWRRLPREIRIGGLLLLVYSLGIVDLLTAGKGGEFRLFLLVLPFLGTLFFGRRGGAFSLALIALTMAGFGWAFSANPLSWLSNTVVLLMLGSLMVFSLDYVVPRLTSELSRRLSLTVTTKDLEGQRDRLQERTRALQRQALQLETSAEVGRAIASILDVDQLLREAVELIRDRFGWYLVTVFLLEEGGERVSLAAVAGDVGAQVLAEGLELSVAETSLVGWAAKHRQPRVASDVSEDGVYRPYPLLPRTASEVALPLMVGGRLLGVLDVEAQEPGAFDENDVKVLQGLADQVAVAIQNAQRVHEEAALLEATSPIYRASRRLAEAASVDEVLDALVGSVAETEADGCVLGLFEPSGDREAEEISMARTWRRHGPASVASGTDLAAQAGLAAQTGWAEHAGLASHARVDVREDPELVQACATRWITSDLEDVSQLPDEGRLFVERAEALVPDTGFAMRAGASFPLATGDRGNGQRPLIGFFFLYRIAPGPFSEASIRLCEVLSDQAAAALERARLLEEAQHRADRERLISETTARMRESLDLETVLNTAASEIGRALGLAALDVRLGAELGDAPTSHVSGGDGGGSHISGFSSCEED